MLTGLRIISIEFVGEFCPRFKIAEILELIFFEKLFDCGAIRKISELMYA